MHTAQSSTVSVNIHSKGSLQRNRKKKKIFENLERREEINQKFNLLEVTMILVLGFCFPMLRAVATCLAPVAPRGCPVNGEGKNEQKQGQSLRS